MEREAGASQPPHSSRVGGRDLQRLEMVLKAHIRRSELPVVSRNIQPSTNEQLDLQPPQPRSACSSKEKAGGKRRCLLR